LLWTTICSRSAGLQLERVAEAALAGVQLTAVDVRVIEDGDADVARLAIEPANGIVAEIGDPHEAENGG
jgi:hypothetical protein